MSTRKRTTGGKPDAAAGRKTLPTRSRDHRSPRVKPWQVIVGAGVVVAAIVGLVAMSPSTSRTAGSGSGANVSAAPSGGGGVGGRMAPFTLTSIDGRPVSVPASRPGALFFSVSGCTSCIPSAQALGTLMKTRLGSRINAVFISMDPQDNADLLRQRRDSVGDPPYPFAIDTSGSLATQYQIQSLGTVVIYDARGQVVDRLIEPTLGELAGGFRKAGVA